MTYTPTVYEEIVQAFFDGKETAYRRQKHLDDACTCKSVNLNL